MDNRSLAAQGERPFYRSYKWRKLSREVCERDPICKLCNAARSKIADHVIPRRNGGTDDLGNLRGVCQSCHSEHTARFGGGFGNVPGDPAAPSPAVRNAMKAAKRAGLTLEQVEDARRREWRFDVYLSRLVCKRPDGTRVALWPGRNGGMATTFTPNLRGRVPAVTPPACWGVVTGRMLRDLGLSQRVQRLADALNRV